ELARRAADELGQRSQQCMIASNHALNALRVGRFEEAEALSHRMVALGGESEGPDTYAAHWMQMFLIRREQGRLAVIEQPFGHAAVEFANRWPLACMLAHAHARAGRTAEARRALVGLGGGDLAQLPRDNEWLLALSFLPEVCEAAGDTARAEQLY